MPWDRAPEYAYGIKHGAHPHHLARMKAGKGARSTDLRAELNLAPWSRPETCATDRNATDMDKDSIRALRRCPSAVARTLTHPDINLWKSEKLACGAVNPLKPAWHRQC